LLIARTSLSAKGLTIKITISGVGLVMPIEIDDATVLALFQVWAGPGAWRGRLSHGLFVRAEL